MTDRIEQLPTVARAERSGFGVVETGGGCTAFQKMSPRGDGYVLITNTLDPMIPETIDEPVIVGWYDADEEQVRSAECLNLEVALDLIAESER